MRSGQELVLRLARLASHESASSLSSSGQSVHSVRSFARKVGDQFKAGGRGKPLPPDKQLKLSEQTTQSLQRMLDPNFQPPILKQSAEDEERWRIAQRLYSRRRMADLRERQKHLQSLIRFKQAALEALPAVLRIPAEIPDDSPFPLLRGLPTHTPPLEGFEEKVTGLEKASTETELGQFFKGGKRR